MGEFVKSDYKKHKNMKKISKNDIKVPAFLRQQSIKAKLRKPTRQRRRTSIAIPSDPTPTFPSEPQPQYQNPITNSPINTDKPSDLRKWVQLGNIEHYFEKIDVVAFTTDYPLRVGDRILIENSEGMFEQTVTSMQIEKEDIRYADQGSDVGLKVLLPTFVGAKVFKVL